HDAAAAGPQTCERHPVRSCQNFLVRESPAALFQHIGIAAAILYADGHFRIGLKEAVKERETVMDP
ncbi:MAG: hypothetical protein VX955_03495, partial [Pseudomonadota bacterium]|nr:hypothetical protein [Pseudomonadota bacterium]